LKLSVLAIVVVGLTSCGGDGGFKACANGESCGGGDITGTWTVTSSCLHAMGPAASHCSSETFAGVDLNYAGTVTYNSDKTFAHHLTMSGTATETFSASCYPINGVTPTCAELDATAQSGRQGVTAHCEGTSACTCTLTFTNAAVEDAGTFTTTTDGVLTETGASGSPSRSTTCVRGTTLTIMPLPETTGQVLSGAIVFTKS
jgi:hypothetical protein